MARNKKSSIQSFMEGFNAGNAVMGAFRDNNMKSDLSDVQGMSQTDAVSGADAITAGNAAREQALSQAQTPEDRVKIEQDYAPTISALENERNRPASTVYNIGTGQNFQSFNDKSAAQDGQLSARENIYRKYGKDEEADRISEMSQRRKLGGLQIEDAQRRNDSAKKLQEVDQSLRTWGDKNVPKDAEGNPVLNDDVMVHLGKQRVFELSKRGLYDEAIKTADTSMQYAQRKIQTESVERQAAVRDAVAAAGMGDLNKAMEVYNRYVPDGSKATDVVQNKDGSYNIKRVSAVNGEPLQDGKFKNLDQFVSSLSSMADSNALTAYVDRTFKHDIEVKRLGLEGARVGIAAKAEDRAQGKDNREEGRNTAMHQGLADYADAEAKGDQNGMSAARRAVLANGGRLDKPAGVSNEFSFVPNQMGGGVAWDKQKGIGTSFDSDWKPQGTIIVPGSPGAAANAPKKGEERVIQEGNNKGKTAVFDGTGWKLK